MKGVGLPIRFEGNGDIVLDQDETLTYNNIRMALFIQENGVPLFPIGSGLEAEVFDPNDQVQSNILSIRLQQAIILGVDNITADEENFIFSRDGDSLNIIIPYIDQRTQQSQTALLVFSEKQRVE